MSVGQLDRQVYLRHISTVEMTGERCEGGLGRDYRAGEWLAITAGIYTVPDPVPTVLTGRLVPAN